MKKILSSTAIIATVFSIGFAASAQAESTGCGLGTMLFDGNKGVAPNVLAVTTNGLSFGNQTFGISSGTLGCEKNDTVKSKAGKLFAFANDNLDKLAFDASRGNGEYLEVTANIIGIKDADKNHFFQVVQNNFSNIFTKNVNTKDAVNSLVVMMAKDEVLKAYKI